MAGDQLAKEPGPDELANADAGQGAVVRDHREVALALPHQFIHQRLGCTTAHKTPNHQARPVGDHVGCFLNGYRFHAVLRVWSLDVALWNGPTP